MRLSPTEPLALPAIASGQHRKLIAERTEQMSSFYQVFIDKEPAIWSGDGLGGIRGRNVTEDIACDMAFKQLRENCVDTDSSADTFFSDFAFLYAGDYCEELLADAKAEMRERDASRSFTGRMVA